MAYTTQSKLLSEFLGTFLLVMSVGFNVSGNTPFAVTAIGFTLMVSIYALGDVSGANFNPAVSLSLYHAGKLAVNDMFLYWVAQLCGGLAAAFGYKAMVHEIPAGLVRHNDWESPALAEMLFTCMLCFVVLNVAATEKNKPNQYYGLAIGLAIIGGGNSSGPVSQGLLNPAVLLGLLLNEKRTTPILDDVAILAGELLGGLFAALIYRIMRPEEFDKTSQPGKAQRVFSEFVGTFYLVLTVGLNVLGGNPFAAWAIAATLACMVYCCASVSGAHLNPAVTLALFLRGSFDAGDMSHYVQAQVAGGIAGGGLAVQLIPDKALSLAPGKGYDVASACSAELLFTFLLTFVVLNIATVDGKNLGEYAGLAVGSCVTSGGFAAGRISGASLNPAVSIGLAFAGMLTKKVTGSLSTVLLAYVIAEFAGAGLAAGVFNAVRKSAGDDDDDAAEVGDDEEKQALLDKEEDLKSKAATEVPKPNEDHSQATEQPAVSQPTDQDQAAVTQDP